MYTYYINIYIHVSIIYIYIYRYNKLHELPSIRIPTPEGPSKTLLLYSSIPFPNQCTYICVYICVYNAYNVLCQKATQYELTSPMYLTLNNLLH